MNKLELEKLEKKMIQKYGDILSKYCIINEIIKGNNAIDIEIAICKTYIEELEYNKGK